MRRRAGIGVALGLVAGLLAGCTGFGPDALFLYVETESNESRQVEIAEARKATNQLLADFAKVNPDVHIHVRHFSSDEIVRQTRFRASRGLGPDLLVSRVSTALTLHQEGLTETVSPDPQRLSEIGPRFLDDFRQGTALLAVPLLAQPQLACYDRRRLPQPPASLEELMTLSDGGLRVGLPLTLPDLYWTASGLGADGALLRLMEADSPAPDAADRRALRRWIDWLVAANLREHVVFADEPSELVSRLEAGELDWISCNSLWLGPLGARFGANLGVSELPGLPGQPARPLTRLRVWSFGRHSTPRQRQLAETFVLFTLNPVNQKRLMLAGIGNLPVNREVLIPTKTSPTFRAMAGSFSRARMLSFRHPQRTEERIAAIGQQLGRAVLGELTTDEVMAMLITPASRSAAPTGP